MNRAKLGEIRTHIRTIQWSNISTTNGRESRLANQMRIHWVLIFIVAMFVGCGESETPPVDSQIERFVVLANDGTVSNNTIQHSCTRDARTGLVWERKADVEGLHDWRNTYSWFDPEEPHHELDYRGTQDNGTCDHGRCDTWNFVQAVNEEGLCGYNDWRIPSRDEMLSISDLRKAKSPPTVDTDFFPLTKSAEYWTANDYSFQPDSAWSWNFKYGHDRVDWKKSPKYVRLVRGAATDLMQVKE